MYTVVSKDEETKNDEEAREIKHMGTQATTTVTKDIPSNEKEKAKKKMKPDKLGMPIEEVERGIIKDGNLKPLCEMYGTFDTIGQRVLEKATIQYLNNFNMNLVEIMT